MKSKELTSFIIFVIYLSLFDFFFFCNKFNYSITQEENIMYSPKTVIAITKFKSIIFIIQNILKQ